MRMYRKYFQAFEWTRTSIDWRIREAEMIRAIHYLDFLTTLMFPFRIMLTLYVSHLLQVAIYGVQFDAPRQH
jgi:hypothetical protein